MAESGNGDYKYEKDEQGHGKPRGGSELNHRGGDSASAAR